MTGLREHKGHVYIEEAKYCWTCMRPTSAGIPGWTAEAVKHVEEDQPLLAKVIWADGTRDCHRWGERNVCVMCKSPDCTCPVHEEGYRIRSNKIAQQWDVANPVI